MNYITYPKIQQELIEYLQGLADPQYQRRVWVDRLPEAGVQHDEFDYAVHFLFDDTALASDPHSTIGWILKDASEANAVSAVVASIEAVFAKYGTKLSDAEYIELPEWQSVVATAATAATDIVPQ